jgi:hypothetical protein
MGNILNFPSAIARGLTHLDRRIRYLPTLKGADHALIEFAAAELLHVYRRINGSEDYSFCVQLPGEMKATDGEALHVDIRSALKGYASKTIHSCWNWWCSWCWPESRCFS